MFNSGCIHHMTGEKDMFTTYQPYESSSEFISFPDDSTSPVIGEGKIAISQDTLSPMFIMCNQLATIFYRYHKFANLVIIVYLPIRV